MGEKLCLIIMTVISVAIIAGIVLGVSAEEFAAGITVIIALCLLFFRLRNGSKGGKT